MEVTITSASPAKHEALVHVPEAELLPHFDKAYEKYRKQMELPGFRKGRAPLAFIKSKFGKMIEDEALHEIANECFKNAMTERNLNPIGEPVMTEMHYHKGEHLHFKVKYEILPPIELKEYTGFTVNRDVHTVTDDDVQGEIVRVRRSFSTAEEAPKVTDSEFIVTADFQETDAAGTALVGKIEKDVKFHLNDDSTVPEVRDALLAAEKGGVYKVIIPRTAEDGKTEEPVYATLTVTGVARMIMPELTDDMVAKATRDKVKTAAEFPAYLRKDMELFWVERGRRQVLGELAKMIVEKNNFEVPEAMVMKVLESRLGELAKHYPKQQLPASFNVEKYVEEQRPSAEFEVKYYLLREEIIKKENLDVEDADVESLAAAESEKIGIDKERLINYYKTSKQARDRILADKLDQLLVARSTVKDVPIK